MLDTLIPLLCQLLNISSLWHQCHRSSTTLNHPSKLDHNGKDQLESAAVLVLVPAVHPGEADKVVLPDRGLPGTRWWVVLSRSDDSKGEEEEDDSALSFCYSGAKGFGRWEDLRDTSCQGMRIFEEIDEVVIGVGCWCCVW